MASQREWSIPEYTDPTNPAPIDREEAVAAFLEAETVLHRMGGAMMIVARRIETGDGQFFTAGYAFRHESFAPAIRQPAVAEEPLGDETGSDAPVVESEPAETGG